MILWDVRSLDQLKKFFQYKKCTIDDFSLCLERNKNNRFVWVLEIGFSFVDKYSNYEDYSIESTGKNIDSVLFKIKKQIDKVFKKRCKK